MKFDSFLLRVLFDAETSILCTPFILGHGLKCLSDLPYRYRDSEPCFR